MAILRPFLTPTIGIPEAVIAKRRPRSMLDPDLYTDRQQELTPEAQADLAPTSEEQQKLRFRQPRFTQDTGTGDDIVNQIAAYASRAAPPKLEPGSRVTSPNMELVQPSAFQKYYQQLELTTQMGQSMLQSAEAKAAFARLNSQTNAASSSVGPNRSSGGGNAYGNAIPSNPQANFKFAQEIAPNFGWNAQELQAWYTLGMKESGWRHTAQNPTSTAYGIGQFLNSTWKTVGGVKTSDPRTQVQYMAQYIRQRYGSPSRALAFHLKNNWY